MLDLLLNLYSEPGKSQKALNILESDYNIPLRSIHKEVDNMCNLSKGIYDEGRAEGRAEGERNKAISIAMEMRKLNVDIAIIKQVTGLSEEEINSI